MKRSASPQWELPSAATGRRPRHVAFNAVVMLALVATAIPAPLAVRAADPTTVAVQGIATALVADDFRRHRTKVEGYAIETADGRLVPVAGPVPAAVLGTEVRASGVMANGTLETYAPGLRQVAPEAVTTNPVTSRKVAVILFNFSDDTSHPVSVAEAGGVVLTNPGSVGAYFKEESQGAVASFTGTVYGWYTIAARAADGCDPYGWSAAAEAAAAANGFTASDYTNIIFEFPETSSCAWAGLGNMPGKRSWHNGWFVPYVVAHEFGHNLGLAHANGELCTDPVAGTRVPFGNGCASVEYGDPLDPMGGGTYGADLPTWMSGRHLRMLGWLPDAAVQTVTADAEVTIAPLEAAGKTPRLVRIPRPGTSEDLFIEFRQPFGTFDAFNPSEPIVNGVSIRVAERTGITDSGLIDTTPATTTLWDAPLAAGRTFVDHVDGLSISTISVSPAGAVVKIAFGPQDSRPPSVAAPSLGASNLPPANVTSATAAVTDPSTVAAGAFRVDDGPWLPASPVDGAWGGTSEGLTRRVNEGGAEAIVAGGGHVCTLAAGGEVMCWGANWNGQLGDGTAASRNLPAAVVGLGEATKIAAGDRHTCALLADGGVRCWGSNMNRQLGTVVSPFAGCNDDECSPLPVAPSGLGKAIDISAGGDETCAVLEDGGVACWGDAGPDWYAEPEVVAGVSGATAVAVGGDGHACALVGGGGIRCWGEGSRGQLGNGSASDSSAPVPVTGISTATALGAGGAHTCALMVDRTVRCWGDNQSGQLGDGTTTQRAVPVAVVGISAATAITANSWSSDVGHTCALLSTGSVRCWGDNQFGALGDGTWTNRPSPVPAAGIDDAVAVTAGPSFTIVLHADGTVSGVGMAQDGALGTSSYCATKVFIEIAGFVASLADGVHQVCAMATDGAYNSSGGGACAALVVTGPRTATSLTLSRDTRARVGGQVALSATLTGAGGAPLAGRTVTFDVNGTPSSSTTNAAGVAVTTITAPSVVHGYPVVASYAGSASEAMASDATELPVLAYSVPSAPSGVTATPGNASATVRWDPPEEDGGHAIANYTVIASPGGQTCTASSWLTCTVTGLTNGVSVTFTVQATTSLGVGPSSDPSAAAVPSADLPGIPTGASAAASGSSLHVTWLAPADSGTSPIDGYTAMAWPGGFTCASTGPGCDMSGLADGLYFVIVAAHNATGDGAWSTPPAVARIDTTSPTATAPKAAITAGSKLGTSTVPVTLAWTGSDPGGSGVDHHELAQSTSGGAYALVASPATAAAVRNLKPSSSTTYRFRVRAVDGAGNPSGWQAGPAFRVLRTQQSSGAVRYRGTWSSVKAASASGASHRVTRARGASATYTFTGRTVAWVATKGTGYGKAKVYLDGAYVTTVNLNAGSTQWRRIVFSRTWSSTARHTLRIVNLATSGHPRTSVDALVVLR